MAGKIGKTVGESQPYWPAAPKRPERRSEHPGRAVRRCRFRRFRLLRLADRHARHRRHRRSRPALHRLPHDGDVLDHAGGLADRPQPPFGGRGLPRQLQFGLSRLSRQDHARGRHPGRDAAPARLSQLHAGQVARDVAHRIGRHRPVRRLAARPRLRSLLRLHGRRDRPVRAGAGARQHAGRSARHLRHGLSPDIRSGRPGHPLYRRSCRRQRKDAVADVAGLRRLPRAAPGAVRPDPQIRCAVRRRLGRRARSPARPPDRAWHRAPGHAPAAAQRCREAVGRAARRREAAFHAPAGGLCRHARSRRPAHRAIDRLPRDGGPARRHPDRDHVGQRRQPGGRAAGHGQCHGPLQSAPRADRGEDRPHRRYRRAGHAFQLPAGLGDGRQHAPAPLQAEHPWRRHPRSAGDGLEQGHRRQGRVAPSVLPRQRSICRPCSRSSA